MPPASPLHEFATLASQLIAFLNSLLPFVFETRPKPATPAKWQSNFYKNISTTAASFQSRTLKMTILFDSKRKAGNFDCPNFMSISRVLQHAQIVAGEMM
jgi:hypothetical protein